MTESPSPNELQTLFRALAGTGTLAFSLTESGCLVSCANEATVMRLGFDPCGHAANEIFAACPALLDLLERAQRTGECDTASEASVPCSDGLRFFDFSIAPSAAGFFVAGTDVTEKVRARKQVEELDRQLDVLRKNDEMKKFALGAARIGVFEIDFERQLFHASPTLEAILGHENLSGDLASAFRRAVHPEDIEMTFANTLRALAAAAPCDQEFRVIQPDGSIIWIHSQGNALRSPGETTYRFYGALQDITERKRIEQELRQAKEQAERANELKSAFLANMSHEIRTPLGALLGFTELLKDSSINEAEKASYLEIIARNGQQLTAIINDVLDLSKIDAGEMTVENVRCSPKQIIEEAASILAVQLREKGITLRIDVAQPLPGAIGTDPTRLRQIVLNILGNAVKFTRQGGITVTASHERNTSGAHLTIDVQDTGIGIAEDQQDRLFKSFTQADESMTRKFGGTGLGLSLSKRLANALGGDVRLLRSAPNEGSLFRIEVEDRLDSARGESVSDRSAVAAAFAPGASDLSNVTVLLVEDSPDNQDLVKRILTRKNATVILANNGLEGVELAASRHYDLILMDVQMPVMDGYSATRALRSKGNRTPIIALTAHALNQVHQRCLDAGCSDYLPKPINSKALIDKVAFYARGQVSPKEFAKNALLAESLNHSKL